jgi:hypothetical protein
MRYVYPLAMLAYNARFVEDGFHAYYSKSTYL